MRALWMMFLAPTLVFTIPVEKTLVDDKSFNKSISNQTSAKFIGIGAGWNPFYNVGRDFQAKADEGISGIITEVGSIMTAMSNIFDIFGPTKKINPKSYGNSPSSDEVEFIGPVSKFLGMFGATPKTEGGKTTTVGNVDIVIRDETPVTTSSVTDLSSEVTSEPQH